MSLNWPEEKIGVFCQSHHIQRLSLFGSVLRNEETNESDIDLLVEFEPGHSPGFIGMGHLQRELSKILGGRPVDLKTPQELSRYFRSQVLATAKIQYDAAA